MSYVNAFFYDETGKITGRTTCPDSELRNLGANVVAVDAAVSMVWTDATHWIRDGAVVERPEMAPARPAMTVPANGIATLTITGLPPEGYLYVDTGEAAPWFDGTVDFSTDVPGPHFLRFESFPYRDVIMEITGT